MPNAIKHNFLFFVFHFSFFLLFANAAFCQKSTEAAKMEKIGLVNVSKLDQSIVIDLKYATNNNFTGKNIYQNLTEAYLQPEMAKKLAAAQKIIKKSHPHLSIVVYDAARPQSIQQKMWNVVRNTPNKRYVTSPGRISMHSYGVAVDAGIVDQDGNNIDMGTGFDCFDLKSQPRHEQEFLQQGKLTQTQINNRLILRKAMRAAGFRSINNEWWHFEGCTRAEAQQKYKPIP